MSALDTLNAARRAWELTNDQLSLEADDLSRSTVKQSVVAGSSPARALAAAARRTNHVPALGCRVMSAGADRSPRPVAIVPPDDGDRGTGSSNHNGHERAPVWGDSARGRGGL